VKALKALRGLPVSIILLILLVILFILSLGLGIYHISPQDVLKILASNIWGNPTESIPNTVVIEVRLPRILAAMLVGATLSLAGGSFQGLFRNPLVSPDILGVSAGAGFGAALAILMSGSRITIEISAFCFALLAVTIVYMISKVVRGNRTLSLVLAGLAISSLFNALFH
jgi:iron complex transport system permease protein